MQFAALVAVECICHNEKPNNRPSVIAPTPAPVIRATVLLPRLSACPPRPPEVAGWVTRSLAPVRLSTYTGRCS